MNLHDYILGIISKKELKITREEVDSAIILYMKAHNSNTNYKEDFIYKRITDYYDVLEILKEYHEKVSDDVNIIVPVTFEWALYFNRVGEYKIINGKQFLTFTINYNKYYYDEENQLLLSEDKKECDISMLRISPSVIRDVKKNKCIIRGKFILVYDDQETIKIYRKPYSAEKEYKKDISKYILNLKFIDSFYGDNKEWAKFILKEITDRVEKNFLRVVYFMICEKYGSTRKVKNKKEAKLEYIFKKNSRNEIKKIPKVFLENEEYKDIFHKGIIVLLISEWRYWDITMMTRLQEIPRAKIAKNFRKIKELYEDCIKLGDPYTDLDNLKILADINSNLQKIVQLFQDGILPYGNIAPGFEEIKEYAEKIRLKLEDEHSEEESKKNAEMEQHYYQELNNESENDFNESDE